MRPKNIVEARFSIIVATSPSVFFTWKVKCYDVGRAPNTGVRARMCWRRFCQNFDTTRAFSLLKKMLQIILPLIALSACLIGLCSFLIGLCACLISLSQKKPISTGLFWEKLVEKCKVVPDYVHFFPKLPIRFATHLRSHFSPWSLTLPTQPCSKNALQIALWLFFPSWTATHLDLGTWWLIRCYGASPCFYNPT